MLLSDQELVGHRIGVLWPEHASYFLGHITAYSQEAGSFISSSRTLPIRASPTPQQGHNSKSDIRCSLMLLNVGAK